jgi:hypothetical protein
MTTRTTTRITIQTRQTIVIRSLRDSFKAWCEHCCEVVLALTPESITGMLQIPAGTLYGLLESGKWHLVEAGARSILVCCKSLANDTTEYEILIEGERQ